MTEYTTKQLMNELEKWGETKLRIFDKEKGKYYEVESIARVLGYGVIFTIGKEVKW